MFRTPRTNVIESDDGFSVEVLGRTGLLYTEGEKSMKIDSEVLTSSEIGLIKKSIKAWNSPFENETVDDNKRDAIIENIRQAFRSQGNSITVW